MISTSTWESCYKYVSIACNIKIFCHCYHIFRPKIGIFVQKPFSNPHEQFLWLFKLPVDALSPYLLAVCHSLSGWFLWVAKYGTGQIKESIICQGMPLNWIYLFYECKIYQEIIITIIHTQTSHSATSDTTYCASLSFLSLECNIGAIFNKRSLFSKFVRID